MLEAAAPAALVPLSMRLVAAEEAFLVGLELFELSRVRLAMARSAVTRVITTRPSNLCFK